MSNGSPRTVSLDAQTTFRMPGVAGGREDVVGADGVVREEWRRWRPGRAPGSRRGGRRPSTSPSRSSMPRNTLVDLAEIGQVDPGEAAPRPARVAAAAPGRRSRRRSRAPSEVGDDRAAELAAAAGNDDPHCAPSRVRLPDLKSWHDPGPRRTPAAGRDRPILDPRPSAGGPPARERRNRRSIPSPRRSTASMQWREWSGYFALERLRRRPRHRVQRDPRGGRPDRRVARSTSTWSAGPTRAGWSTGCHPRRDEADASAASSTRRGATSTARSSTTARSTASTTGTFRWTAADPQLRWLRHEQRRAGRHDRRRDRGDRRARPPGAAVARRSSRPRPASRSRTSATSGGGGAAQGRREGRRRRLADRLHRRSRLRAVGRRRQAVALWDALWAAGQDHAIRPAGMLALDVVRLEAGLILLEVDYTSARHAMNPEQNYCPAEIGLGRLVSFDKADFVGASRSSAKPAPAVPARRLVGLAARLVRHRGPVQRPGPAAGDLPDRRPLAAAGLRRRSPGRPGDVSSAGARSSSRRSRWRPCRRPTRRRARGSTSNGRSRAGAAGSRRPSSSCRSSISSASAPRVSRRPRSAASPRRVRGAHSLDEHSLPLGAYSVEAYLAAVARRL